MAEEKQGYKSMQVSFQQEGIDCMLDGKLFYYGTDCQDKTVCEFSIFDTVQHKHIYSGNLQETIELILLGKIIKDQMQKVGAKK